MDGYIWRGTELTSTGTRGLLLSISVCYVQYSLNQYFQKAFTENNGGETIVFRKFKQPTCFKGSLIIRNNME